jgi:hypothetical protein
MKIVIRYGFIVNKQSPDSSRFTVIKYRKKNDRHNCGSHFLRWQFDNNIELWI